MTPTSRAVSRWAPALVWLSLPLTAGSSFANALDNRASAISLTAVIGLWLLWVVGLIAALTPSSVSLTTLRILMPASVVAAAWAALVVPHGADFAESAALGVTSLCAVLSLSAGVGYTFINGSSYGDERRFPLRPPGPIVCGPVELVWVAMVASAFAGPMLLAAKQWIPGALISVLAVALVIGGARALHQLSKRWLVFVPAGIVLVDRTTLLDALLVQRHTVGSIGLADEDSSATDLSAGALGIQVEVRLSTTDSIIPTPMRRDRHKIVEPVDVDAVRFTPTRPGWVLDAAKERRFTVG
ncbi:MAG: hypothetical protein QNL59_01060 [Actinomycetota bacterium]